MVEVLSRVIHLPYFPTILLSLWCAVITIVLIVKGRKFRKFKKMNELEHKQLMKNQNTLNQLIKKLTVLLKEDSELSRTLKATVVQKILPFVRNDMETRNLIKEIEKAESLKKEAMDQLRDKSKELDDLNRKYRKLKEDLELERNTIRIEKLP